MLDVGFDGVAVIPMFGLGRGACRSGTSSARTTAISRGASIPSLTCPSSRRMMVTQMSSPMKSFSISFRVNTSMAPFLQAPLGSVPNMRRAPIHGAHSPWQ